MHPATQPLNQSPSQSGQENSARPPLKPNSQRRQPPAHSSSRQGQRHQTASPSVRHRQTAAPRVQHRIGAVMAHVPWYAFKSQARLAADLGFSKSAVSRLLRGECTPSLALACSLANTLEKRLGRPLELRELFSLDGTYPTPSACQLVGCANCLPPEAYDRDDNLRPEYRTVPAGQWSVAAPRQGAAANSAAANSAAAKPAARPAPALRAKTQEAR